MPDGRLHPRPSVVFLDLGDTLIRAHPSWAAIYGRVLAGYGIQIAPAALEAALEATYGGNGDHVEGPFEASAEASYRRIRHFDSAVLDALGLQGQPDDLHRALQAASDEPGAWWVYEDVEPALDALVSAGLRLAIITNWTWSCPDLVDALGLARHIEAVVVSDRIGYLKPSPGIFRHALRVMDVAPEDAIHVGDSYPADVVGARSVGIRPVLVRRATGGHSTYRHSTGLPADDPVPTITGLFELLGLLGVAHPFPDQGGADDAAAAAPRARLATR